MQENCLKTTILIISLAKWHYQLKRWFIIYFDNNLKFYLGNNFSYILENNNDSKVLLISSLWWWANHSLMVNQALVYVHHAVAALQSLKHDALLLQAWAGVIGALQSLKNDTLAIQAWACIIVALQGILTKHVIQKKVSSRSNF